MSHTYHRPKKPTGAGLFDGTLAADGDSAVRTGTIWDALPGAPLAMRMRPRNLDEIVGQEHLLGPGKALRRAIESDQLSSMILWGPPGSGKTSLVAAIAGQTRAHLIAVTGVSAGVADLRQAAEDARGHREQGQRTILFIDEIHRFNKAQQDAVLPHAESGLIILIGATTENPSFEVNSALLSRSRVYRLVGLTEDQLHVLLERALADPDRGLGNLSLEIDDGALDALVELAGGDARVALNALELAAAIAPETNGVRRNAAERSRGSPTESGTGGGRRLDREIIAEAVQRRALSYDRAGDQHFDTVSALIKSIRGSDPDAAVYWLARMLEAGEDPLFVARRLVILASEDVGLADPAALSVAVAAQQAAHFIGMPEALFPLSEAALYLACAPKSNSAGVAYQRAAETVHESGDLPVPLHLRNAPTPLMKASGYGKGYKYAHAFEGHVAAQQHLPDPIAGRQFYDPSDQGREADLRQRVAELRARLHQKGDTGTP
ncbi:MAG TPA: replication-associated recombination protein A [Chloroflexota bacterium]